MGKILIKGQFGKKVVETPLQPMAAHDGMCLLSQLYEETQIGGLQLEHKAKLYFKRITKSNTN
jgi:hypothetical protein